ncbi:hypothetical protein JCM10213_002436 [Rhodosporidiobolus nylandii]
MSFPPAAPPYPPPGQYASQQQQGGLEQPTDGEDWSSVFTLPGAPPPPSSATPSGAEPLPPSQQFQATGQHIPQQPSALRQSYLPPASPSVGPSASASASTSTSAPASASRAATTPPPAAPHQVEGLEVSSALPTSRPNPNPSPRSTPRRVGPGGVPFAPPYTPKDPLCAFCAGTAKRNKHNRAEEMVSCYECGSSGHPTCLEWDDWGMVKRVKGYAWLCQECKRCEVCDEKGDDDDILFCDSCDRGWHRQCLDPPLATIPRGKWTCPTCVAQTAANNAPGVLEDGKRRERKQARPLGLSTPGGGTPAGRRAGGRERRAPSFFGAEEEGPQSLAMGRKKGKARAVPDSDGDDPAAGAPFGQAHTWDGVLPSPSYGGASGEDWAQHPRVKLPSAAGGGGPSTPGGGGLFPLPGSAHDLSALPFPSASTSTSTPGPAPKPKKSRPRPRPSRAGDDDSHAPGDKPWLAPRSPPPDSSDDERPAGDEGPEDPYGGLLSAQQAEQAGRVPDERDKARWDAAKAAWEGKENAVRAERIKREKAQEKAKEDEEKKGAAIRKTVSQDAGGRERSATPGAAASGDAAGAALLLGVSGAPSAVPAASEDRSLRAPRPAATAALPLTATTANSASASAATAAGILPITHLLLRAPTGLEPTPLRVETWYQAPFPEELAKSADGGLWVCEGCLKYSRGGFEAGRHKLKCKTRHPPGDEIYRDGMISVFEVDGRKNKIYCQNLCLLAKQFLNSKTLYYDVEPFLFYVMTEASPAGSQFVGYFSKEKRSPTNNVSCIMTLPVRQRRGWGNLLIDFSYLLSLKEGRVGTPERPLSDLGLLSYRNYWTLTLFQYFAKLRDDHGDEGIQELKFEDISKATSMTRDDIYFILHERNFITDLSKDARPIPSALAALPPVNVPATVPEPLEPAKAGESVMQVEPAAVSEGAGAPPTPVSMPSGAADSGAQDSPASAPSPGTVAANEDGAASPAPPPGDAPVDQTPDSAAPSPAPAPTPNAAAGPASFPTPLPAGPPPKSTASTPKAGGATSSRHPFRGNQWTARKRVPKDRRPGASASSAPRTPAGAASATASPAATAPKKLVVPTSYRIQPDMAVVDAYLAKHYESKKDWIRLRPDRLKWTPFLVTRGFGLQAEVGSTALDGTARTKGEGGLGAKGGEGDDGEDDAMDETQPTSELADGEEDDAELEQGGADATSDVDDAHGGSDSDDSAEFSEDGRRRHKKHRSNGGRKSFRRSARPSTSSRPQRSSTRQRSVSATGGDAAEGEEGTGRRRPSRQASTLAQQALHHQFEDMDASSSSSSSSSDEEMRARKRARRGGSRGAANAAKPSPATGTQPLASAAPPLQQQRFAQQPGLQQNGQTPAARPASSTGINPSFAPRPSSTNGFHPTQHRPQTVPNVYAQQGQQLSSLFGQQQQPFGGAGGAVNLPYQYSYPSNAYAAQGYGQQAQPAYPALGQYAPNAAGGANGVAPSPYSTAGGANGAMPSPYAAQQYGQAAGVYQLPPQGSIYQPGQTRGYSNFPPPQHYDPSSVYRQAAPPPQQAPQTYQFHHSHPPPQSASPALNNSQALPPGLPAGAVQPSHQHIYQNQPQQPH